MLTIPPPSKRPNNSLIATTLSFGIATDLWVGSPRKRSKTASVGGLLPVTPSLPIVINTNSACVGRKKNWCRLAFRDPAAPAGGDDGDRGQLESGNICLYQRLTRHAGGDLERRSRFVH